MKKVQIKIIVLILLILGAFLALIGFLYIVYLGYTFQEINQELIELLAENAKIQERQEDIKQVLNETAKAKSAPKAKTRWPFNK